MTEQNHNAQKIGTAEDRVIIFDTTLRDGEQSPGASMTLDEKLRVAETLDDMGVDVIEAGFPIASNGDFEAVTEVSKLVKNATVCGLARAGEKDIERAAQALKPAANRRIHTFISTSPVHMKHKLQMEPEQVLEAIAFSVDQARRHTDDVEWSPEDATRTDRDFLCKAVETAINAGATTVNIPDTVGYTLPDEYFDIISMLRNQVPNIDRAVISTHCHNDLGLAVANSLAGVRAGARQVECTINGLGERAGNAALEEIVMAMNVRHDLMPQWTGIDTTNLMRASKLVSAVTAFPVQYNKAIVGQNAFAHESGIHQDGMLKNNQTYEIMLPESVGISQSALVLGKHSGRHAFREKIIQMGYQMGDNEFQEAFVRFKELADKKKQVFDEDIAALVDDAEARKDERIKVVSLQVVAGSVGPQKATLELEIDGELKKTETSGDGPVDATFNAIKELFPTKARLKLYQVHAVTQGTDAQAEVSVRLSEDGKTVTGRGVDTDTMVASARAYVSALNKLLVKRLRHAPDDVATLRI
ncbi:MAG: 2-isopropylmalate synthase [Parvibaculales bacterium]